MSANPDDPRERFASLYEAHYEKILLYAVRRLGPDGAHDLAHDVAAETFLIAWRRAEELPAADAEALPWLYGVARNVVANERRGRRRQDRLRERMRTLRRGWQPVRDHADRLADGDRVLLALSLLSGRDQEILRLVGWEELDGHAAALALGCSTRTFTVRLHRARRRLAAALERLDRPDEVPAGWNSALNGAAVTRGRS